MMVKVIVVVIVVVVIVVMVVEVCFRNFYKARTSRSAVKKSTSSSKHIVI